MSDGKQKRLIPAWRAILLAVVAGALAGAVAVYVRGAVSGNRPVDVAPAPASVAEADATPEDKACAAKAERAKTVSAAATGQVAAMLPADPPQSLAGLSFSAPTGKLMTLGERKGKTVLLNLWATWCAPCRAEMPALDALQKEAGSADFEVIAVNVDTGDDTKPRKFLAETQVASLAYYRENTLSLFNGLKQRGLALGLPVTLLIDKDGCLLASMNGPADWSGTDAKKLIEAARAG